MIYKASLIKSQDIEGVVFAQNDKNFFVLDSNNNVMSILKNKEIQLTEDLFFLETRLSVALGIEDNRWIHHGIKSETMEIDPSLNKYLNKISKHINLASIKEVVSYQDGILVLNNGEVEIFLDLD